MKITLLAVGRLGRIPEALLAKDYADRATASGREIWPAAFISRV